MRNSRRRYDYNDSYYGSASVGRRSYGRIGGYDRTPDRYSQYGRDKPGVRFWDRNDGYSAYYGSEEDEGVTITSKILSVLSTAVSKAKPNAYKNPTAQSSNLTYAPAEKSGSYSSSGVLVSGRDGSG